MRRFSTPLAVASACTIVVACADAPTRSQDGRGGVTASSPDPSQQINPPRTIDDDYVSLVDSVPGFGGWFIDDDGTPTAVLVDTNKLAQAARHLAPRVESARRSPRPDGSFIGSMLRVKRGNFDFRQLRTWAYIAERVLDQEQSAVYVDANEENNVVEIGLSDVTALNRVTRQLVDLGVPGNAVQVKVTALVRNLVDISEKVRPIPAGVRVQRSGIEGCTFGFHAKHSATGSLRWFTNSHCTPAFGSVIPGSTWFQAFVAQGDSIGFEHLDPSPWQETSDCRNWRFSFPYYPNGVCRYSDAAEMTSDFISPDSVDFGYIARTMFRGGLHQAGSTTIDPSNRHFEIASKYYSIPVGVYLEKMGYTTGWTVHNVSNACATVYNYQQIARKMWCQALVGASSANAQAGDSGSPMWAYDYCDSGQLTRPDGTQCVRLAGIFWGLKDDDRGVFSPIENVEWEFGALYVRPADK